MSLTKMLKFANLYIYYLDVISWLSRKHNYKKLNKNRVDYKVKDVIPNWNELFKLILK